MVRRAVPLVLAVALGSAAVAQDLSPFRVQQADGVVRYSVAMMLPNQALGETRVFNPTVIGVGDRLAMIYRRYGTGVKSSSLQLAYSDDGRTFVTAGSTPVIVPDRPCDALGCEDPRVDRFGERFYLTYVGDLAGGHEEQCLAVSSDLIHWDKRGEILRPQGWNAGQVKAGVIVPELVAGRYIMYFTGQTKPWQTSIGMAVSTDLEHWTQPLDHALMDPRSGHFDSLGVECGAEPIMLPEGILLIYNGWNAAHVHATGWILFDKNDPSRVLRRCAAPFIMPTYPYEMHGRNVFTFTEGAVFFKGLWRFYYGAADQCIGLAEVGDLATLIDRPTTGSLPVH